MDLSALDAKIDLSEGDWIEDDSGARFCVRSTNYKPFRVGSAGIARKAGKDLKTAEGVVDFAVKAGKPLAEHILTDWDLSKAEGLLALTVKGKPAPYSAELALRTLTANDPYGIGNAFRSAVEAAGDAVAARIASNSEEAAGN